MIMMGDKKKMVTAILGPESDNVGKVSEKEGMDTLEAIAGELIDCVHAKDAAGVAAAFKAAFDELEAEPHHEYKEEG